MNEAVATTEAAPKKHRNPRKEYGYAKDAVIQIVPELVKPYRGKRKEWFEAIRAGEGQTVEAWEAGKGAEKDPARGWLRHFAQAGAVRLAKPN